MASTKPHAREDADLKMGDLPEFSFPLEQIAERSLRGDAFCREHTCKRGVDISARVIGMQSEGPAIGITVPAESYLLNDLCACLGLSNGTRWRGWVEDISLPGNVVEEIPSFSSTFPDAQTEASILRGARRVHDFRSIAVPDRDRVVDDQSTRDRGILAALSFRGKDDVPHTDDLRFAVAEVFKASFCEL